MVALVGESPLPLYLSLRQFLAEGGKAILLHSARTEPQARAILSALEPSRRCILRLLPDPFNPTAVLAEARSIVAATPNALLDFTGGTKVMSAFSLVAWRERGAPHVYLEEARNLFHTTDEGETPLVDVGMTVREMAALHGFRPRATGAPRLAMSSADVSAIFSLWRTRRAAVDISGRSKFQQRDVAAEFDWSLELRPQWLYALRVLTSETASRWRSLSVPVDAADYERSEFRQAFRFFACSQWLEYLIAELVLSLSSDPASRLLLGDRPRKPAVDPSALETQAEYEPAAEPSRPTEPRNFFEVDVVCVTGNRLRLVSVTTATAVGMCKSKLQQAIFRAKQLGGPSAVACLVSLAGMSPHYRRPVAEVCEEDAGGGGRHRVFGLADVEQWMRGNGASLSAFLKGAR
jgi:hypothetical protein